MKAARASMGAAELDAAIAKATPEQIAAGKKCFSNAPSAVARGHTLNKPSVKVIKAQRQKVAVAKKQAKRAARVRHKKVKTVAVPLPPVRPPPPVVDTVLVTQAQAGTTPVALVSVSERTPMNTFDIFVYLGAVIGGIWFVYQVYTRGIVPVAQTLSSWWGAGKADVIALKGRLDKIEALLAPHLPVQNAAPATPPSNQAQRAEPAPVSPAAAA
jgi:hypothetical protein